MANIVVGKHTLESLTLGMYTNSLVIYRELVQNAVDSIDEAFKRNVLKSGEECVNIDIYPTTRTVTITDNGLGIPSSEAENTLTSIGNSKKGNCGSRGFRGIGRLSALSCCTQLVFETSCSSETIGVRIIFDATRLAEAFSLDNASEITTLDELISSICRREEFTSIADEHFFRVKIIGIDHRSELLDLEKVLEYLQQVAPVPYDTSRFQWASEIAQRIAHLGYSIPEYRIEISKDGRASQVKKPYCDTLFLDKDRSKAEHIMDVETFVLNDAHGKPTAFGWTGVTEYLGTIIDHSIKGIRIRQGNVLIGNEHTLNTVFKDARFNGWLLGEVFVVDSKESRLIPNARRDAFEKNAAYFCFMEQMMQIAADRTKAIRSASTHRNAQLSTALSRVDEVCEDIAASANAPLLSPQQKGTGKLKLTKVKNDLINVSIDNVVEESCQEIAFDKIDMLLGEIQGVTAYKSINLLTALTKQEKKVLERVFHALGRYLTPDDLNVAVDRILKEFAASSKLQA